MPRWKTLTRAAFAVALTLVVPGLVAPRAADAAAKPAASSTSKSRPAGLRQFTGWVTAMDKESITVEKRGSEGRTVVFSRNAELRTVGAVEKDARVTVYYKDEDGTLTAHRVVAKVAKSSAAAPKKRGDAAGSGSGSR